LRKHFFNGKAASEEDLIKHISTHLLAVRPNAADFLTVNGLNSHPGAARFQDRDVANVERHFGGSLTRETLVVIRLRGQTHQQADVFHAGLGRGFEIALDRGVERRAGLLAVGEAGALHGF